MRRKYFMRGLGLGVIITALIFTISLTIGGGRNGGMTDGEIIKRARELGMVSAENATMSDAKTKTDGSEDTKDSGEGTEGGEGSDGSEGVEGSEPNGSDTATSGDSNVTVEELTGSDVKPAPNLTTSPSSSNNNTTGGLSNPPGVSSGSTTGNKTGNTQVTESAPGVSQTTNQNSSSEKIVKFSVRSGENSAIVAANLYKAGLVSSPTDFDSFLEANGYDKSIRPGTYSIRSGSSNETIAKAITGN